MQAESTITETQFFDFHPTKEAASDILAALADPDETIREVAHRFHTTLDALAEWYHSPPIQKRIEAMKRFALSREEFMLIVNKRIAIDALVSLLEANKHDEEHIPVNPQSIRSITQRDRRRATTRLAASQFLRLASKNPLPEGGGRGWVDDTRSATKTEATESDSASPSHIITSSPTHSVPFRTSASSSLRSSDSPAHPLTSSPPHNSPLRAPPCDPVFHPAAAANETG